MFLLYVVLTLVLAHIWQRYHRDWQVRLEKREDIPACFTYTPLQSGESIRLLAVLSSGPSEPVRLCLKEYDDPPPYRCLSYMWGTETELREVLVNGQKLCVRKNLYEYLCATRGHFATLLWVDAVCINQEDDTEKSHQVQRMGKIYRQAVGVQIWLGSEGSFVDLQWWMEKRQSTLPKGHVLALLKTLLFHPYWERAWIAQEVLLAKSIKILHASGEIDWNLLGPLSRSLLDRGHPDAHSFRTSHPMMLWKWQAEHTATTASQEDDDEAESLFWKILGRRVKSKCYDPRDRIYSLLALDGRASSFKVDYKEPAARLFERAGEHMGAWSSPSHIRILCGALDLDYATLRESLADQLDSSISVPVRAAFLSNPLKTHMTDIVVCQNGHHKHTFPFPRKTRHDILLCPSTRTRIFDDSQYTHALLSPIEGSDRFSITLSHSIVFRKGHAPEYLQLDLCRAIEGAIVENSWSYVRANLKPGKPQDGPCQWSLKLPLRWVIYRLGMEERHSAALVQLPTIESEQYDSSGKDTWFGNEPVRHKFARYVTRTGLKV
ncbi:hypothetical protein ACN47E_002819 [Coniothyrium glycines]